MRDLLTEEYFPYGSQYYRAPSPRREDWERDLRHMKEQGFNMVKFWLQWRWNHPEEGRFYFEDIDRLMDLSAELGLKVMLNTIVDVAPAWIYRKYPDASMLTLDGRRIGPQTQPHRQIGGLGVCLNHAEVMDHLFRFLRASFERYSGHPALAIWNVASEPELTQSMAEMRLYADDAAKMGDMLCFCAHCETRFKGWLREKYGSIDRLNLAWNRNYTAFEDAELPKTRNTFNDVVDWRMFFVHTVGENVRRRFEVAQEADAGRHPLMCHHVFIQGFPITSTGSDPWNVGRFGDLHGCTQMDDPMMCDVLRSCARDKPVISAEMLMLFGYTLDLPDAISADDIKRHVFTGIAADLKGFLFWQFRPETLGREAPTWGLAHLDGSTTPWLDAFGEVGRVLQKNAAFLLDAHPPKAEVGVLYHPENQVFAWASTGNEKTATDSILGAHRALYDGSYTVDLVHPRDIAAGVLDQYKVLYLPFPYWLGKDVAERLKAWVHGGGVLIAEAYCGGWNVEEGRHHTTIPGYGLDEVFGIRQANAEPARQHRFTRITGVARHDAAVSLHPGLNEPHAGEGFVHVEEAGREKGALGIAEITLTRDVPRLAAGRKVYGALVKETFIVENAEVLGTFADGQPALTAASYGAGKAILIGSYVGLPFLRNRYPSNAGLIVGLVEAHAPEVRRPKATGTGQVRVDTLSGDDGTVMLMVQNLEASPAEAVVQLPFSIQRDLEEQFTGERPTCTDSALGSILTVNLLPKQVKVYLTT